MNERLYTLSICDACACGGDITKCQLDVYETIIDACDRPLTYCSKHKKVSEDE